MTTDLQIQALAMDPPQGTHYVSGDSKTAWLAHYLPMKAHNWIDRRFGKLVVRVVHESEQTTKRILMYRWAAADSHRPGELTEFSNVQLHPIDSLQDVRDLAERNGHE